VVHVASEYVPGMRKLWPYLASNSGNGLSEADARSIMGQLFGVSHYIHEVSCFFQDRLELGFLHLQPRLFYIVGGADCLEVKVGNLSLCSVKSRRCLQGPSPEAVFQRAHGGTVVFEVPRRLGGCDVGGLSFERYTPGSPPDQLVESGLATQLMRSAHQGEEQSIREQDPLVLGEDDDRKGVLLPRVASEVEGADHLDYDLHTVPEVQDPLGQGLLYGASADVWILAVVMYVLLTGIAPLGAGQDAGTSPDGEVLQAIRCREALAHLTTEADERAKESRRCRDSTGDEECTIISTECLVLLKDMMQANPIHRASFASILESPWMDQMNLPKSTKRRISSTKKSSSISSPESLASPQSLPTDRGKKKKRRKMDRVE